MPGTLEIGGRLLPVPLEDPWLMAGQRAGAAR